MIESLKVLPFTKPEPPAEFELGAEVAVSDFSSPFYSWRGKVSATLVKDEIVRYQVRFLIANNSILMPPLLFWFGDLELVK